MKSIIRILIGVLYLAVGIASAALAGAAASNQMRSFWRLSAFVISAVVFAAHIAYEHFRLRNTARPWPLLTAVPAFIVARVVAAILGAKRLGG